MIRPALVLTAADWAVIADWLEHGREFEADSQKDEPRFQWPELSGPLLDKIAAALRDGNNVVIRPDVLDAQPAAATTSLRAMFEACSSAPKTKRRKPNDRHGPRAMRH